jgi:hypothetical protein
MRGRRRGTSWAAGRSRERTLVRRWASTCRIHGLEGMHGHGELGDGGSTFFSGVCGTRQVRRPCHAHPEVRPRPGPDDVMGDTGSAVLRGLRHHECHQQHFRPQQLSPSLDRVIQGYSPVRHHSHQLSRSGDETSRGGDHLSRPPGAGMRRRHHSSSSWSPGQNGSPTTEPGGAPCCGHHGWSAGYVRWPAPQPCPPPPAHGARHSWYCGEERVSGAQETGLNRYPSGDAGVNSSRKPHPLPPRTISW